MNRDKALEIAKEAMDNLDYKYPRDYIALRMLPSEQDEYEVGELLPASWRWENGEMTNDKLDGTCGIGVGRISALDENDFLRALDKVVLYPGSRLAMLRSESVEGGADPGEVICAEPLIEFIWTLSEEDKL